MLTQLALHDFKSFAKVELALAPVTLLVGANASGKSNVLDALRVLRGLSLPLGIGEALDGKAGVWTGVRGGSQEAARIGCERFRIDSTWFLRSLPPDPPTAEGPRPTTVFHELEVQTRPKPAIKADRFGTADSIHDAYGWGDDSVEHGRSVLGPGVMLRADERVLSAWGLRYAASGLQPFDLVPDQLRGFHPTAASSVGEHGDGLIPALFRLLQTEPARRIELVDWLSELCAPKLIDIDFVEVKETGDVMLVLVEEGPRRVTSRSASDGTLRFLGLIAALWLARSDAILVLEEPELGLHPARLGLVAELLATRRDEVQVIATTHSPALLAHLSEATLADVLAFGRDSVDGGDTRAARLGGLPHFASLVSSRDVAHLFSTGWMERAL